MSIHFYVVKLECFGNSKSDGCKGVTERRRDVSTIPRDKSNGYEEVAEHFISARNVRIGPSTVREWSRTLARGSSILDLGCGHGVPISQVLVEEGFDVYGVDGSAKLIEAFRDRFPGVHAEYSSVEDSEFFGRTFDGVVAIGLMFLLTPDVQADVIRKVSSALNLGGNFLFTSAKEVVEWRDSLTGRESVSLGAERYVEILREVGLTLVGEKVDEGGNHYYCVAKPGGA
jgi:2-polyprenyl-3-methyl-5-hydroxy-6-metoxy-1,4-benzoquinol methylase